MAKNNKKPNLNFIPIFKCHLNLFKKCGGIFFLVSKKFIATTLQSQYFGIVVKDFTPWPAKGKANNVGE
jgi:hypothetical protein